jgi:hypothetical protein
MKEINGEMFGTCIFCGVVGQGKNDFICLDCGAPDKLMLVCKCGRRINLTPVWGGPGLSGLIGSVISWDKKDEEDLNLGMTISAGKCSFCKGREALEKEAGIDLKIYNVRNQGFNVGA